MAGEALLATVRFVWATLKAQGIDAALMGGIAVAAWQHLRNTRDVDLLISVEPAFEVDLMKRLSEAGFTPLRQPPILTLGEARILQLTFEPPDKFLDVRIDLFFADSEFHRLALSRRIPITLSGVAEPLYILSCEDLILFKLLAGRLIDRSDVAHLLRLNRDGIDLKYLTEWLSRLALSESFRETWSDAFPGTDPPVPPP
jgi:hypothetical protein